MANGSNRETKRDMPLAGVKVLEFGQFAAGPFTGMLLADWGADVVKIEPIGGEGLRDWPPHVDGPDGSRYSLNFASISRNKRSVTLDLKNPEGIATAKKLAASADILIENFRPGVMQRFGLGFEDLAALNRKLVYCSVTGFGQTGPYSRNGAFDIAIQAMSGIMSVTGETEGPPAKCGVPVADFCTAVFAAFSSMVALRQAEATGQGAYIDCPMLSCMLAISALQTSEYWGTGEPPKRLGSGHPRNAPYEGFRARDKSFVLAAGNDRLWQRVCEVVGRPDLFTDERFATQPDRAKNRIVLANVLEEIFADRDAAEWMALFEDAGIPCAPINDYREALENEHVEAIDLVRDMALPHGVKTFTVANPVSMTGYNFEIFQRPPLPGEHNDEVLGEWGRG